MRFFESARRGGGSINLAVLKDLIFSGKGALHIVLKSYDKNVGMFLFSLREFRMHYQSTYANNKMLCRIKQQWKKLKIFFAKRFDWTF